MTYYTKIYINSGKILQLNKNTHTYNKEWVHFNALQFFNNAR